MIRPRYLYCFAFFVLIALSALVSKFLEAEAATAIVALCLTVYGYVYVQNESREREIKLKHFDQISKEYSDIFKTIDVYFEKMTSGTMTDKDNLNLERFFKEKQTILKIWGSDKTINA